jgi:chromosome segregation ATPase
MPKKENDDLLDVPSMVPDSDDVRMTAAAKVRARKPSPKTAASTKPGTPSQQQPSLIGTESAGGFWMTAAILALLLALASSGAAVFLYQQVQLTVKDLNQADARLVSLENKLLSTDESMSESSDMMRIKINAMAKQLDVNFKEIDKLWAARNSLLKNSKASSGQLSTQAKQIKALQGDLNTKLANLKKTVDTANQNQTKLNNIADQSLAVSLTVDALQQALDEQQQQMRTLVDADNGLKSNNAAVDKRLQDHDEWVASFNGYRKQVNQRLTALEQQTGAL